MSAHHTSEPSYQVQHGTFIISFYPDELKDRASVQKAAEEHLRRAYGLRHIDPPETLSDDLAGLVERVVEDMAIE